LLSASFFERAPCQFRALFTNDLMGDPNRFKTLGELVAEIYRTIWTYNHMRIHSTLKMPPQVFAEKIAASKNGEFLLRVPV
jgi:hypothetical protein